MVVKTIEYKGEYYDKMVLLRFEILRKPLGLIFTEADLAKDEHDTLIALTINENIEGCCILTEKNNTTVQLRQMAVNNLLQGKGMGRKIMDYAEQKAKENGYQMLMMHARLEAREFYERLGYVAEGEVFEEVSIPHITMKKKLV